MEIGKFQSGKIPDNQNIVVFVLSGFFKAKIALWNYTSKLWNFYHVEF